ncbi:FUSC family protein [Legionella dresdenensis]|uniref:FUSC family protein n=1 Tax=Legionella dresdenensis TaxID=450200 RepID=A0ABV8CCJ6_9GAMM
MQQLSNTTRMGIQAAAAVAIAEFISYLFHMERGYWTVLTAMALITQTWGESLKRSFERVAMTVLGGAAGTLLYLILPQNQFIILGALLLFVFFAVYLLQIYNILGVFAMTGFVVFLFAMAGAWTFELLWARIVDTAIGALIALAVGRFFLPVRTDVAALFAGHFDKIDASLQLAFDNKQTNQIITSQQLFYDFQQIRKNSLAISYEILFHRMSRKNFYFLITQTAFCTQYAISLMDAYGWLASDLTKEDMDKVKKALDATRHNLQCLKQRLLNQDAPAMLPAINLTDEMVRAINKEPERFATLDTEVLGFYNIMYFFGRFNTRLNDIYFLLEKILA